MERIEREGLPFPLLLADGRLRLVAGCHTPDDQAGVCIPVVQCPPLVALLRQRPVPPESVQFLRNSQCGFQANIPLVSREPRAASSVENSFEPVIASAALPHVQSHSIAMVLALARVCKTLFFLAY